jgi:hypothetical protein
MGSGKRDFSEFNAKLEKHIERLPDYAQRAQEKLQKYFPPGEERPNGSVSSDRPAPRPMRPAPPQRPLRVPMPPGLSPADIPVIAEVRTKWARWNEPAAKLERRKRRTSRALLLWVVLTLLCGLYAFAAASGFIGAPTGDMGSAVAAMAGVVVFGALGVRSGARLYKLNHSELPVSPAQMAPPPLPAASSAAREPMERLAECEASLAELLRQLSVPTALGTTWVPEVSVADARATATEAAAALRGLAGRIQAIERARNASPAAEHGALDAAIRALREQLDDGLEGYGGLIAAAGRAVAASSGGVGASKQALTDATDHLAGLALALRELS